MNGSKKVYGIWIVSLIIIILLGYLPISLRPSMWSKLLGVQISTLFITIYFFISRRKKALFVVKSPIVILYSLFVVSLIPSCILSVNSALAWSEITKLLSFFLVFLMAVFILNRDYLRTYFTRGLIFFVLISVAVAGIQLTTLSFNNLSGSWLLFMQKWFGGLPATDSLHQETYFIKSMFSHRNLFAQLMLLSLPFIGFSIYSERGFFRYLSLFTFLIMLIPIVFLFVRSVWFVGALTFVFSIILLMTSFGLNTNYWKKFKWIFVVLVLWLGVSFFVIHKKNSINQTIIKQNIWLKNTSFGSANERLLMWKSTLDMINDKPLFGVGPNNWSIVFPRYANFELRDVSKGHYTQFQRPHNDYLQMIAEYGGVSFFLYMIMMIWVSIIIIRKLSQESQPKEKMWNIALLLFLIIYAGISFFSFPKERIEHQVLLSLILAFSITKRQAGFYSQWHLKKIGFILTLIILLIIPLIYHSFLMLKSDINLLKAYEMRALGKESQYIYFKKAKNKCYSIDPNGTPIDWYLSYEYSSLGNIPMAERLLKSSIQVHPYHKQSLNDLGTIFYQTKGRKEAAIFYLKALKLSPSFVDANVNMAVLKYQSNEMDSAWFYLSHCDTINYHSNYRPIMDAVSISIGNELINEIEVEDSLLTKKINEILINPNWVWLCCKHAIENNQNLRQQFVEEAVYVLYQLDKIIEEDRENYYLYKYKLL